MFSYRLPCDIEDRLCDHQVLSKLFGFTYLHDSRFQDWEIEQAVQRWSRRALRKHRIASYEKWLGSSFATALTAHSFPQCAIRWVSTTIGFGLYTQDPIAPWSFVGEYHGVIRFHSLFSRETNPFCFMYPRRKGFTHITIDASKQGNLFRFVNHSKDPNMEALAVFYQQRYHIVFRAIQSIAPNTELTFDYGNLYWRNREHLLRVDSDHLFT